MSNTFKQLSGLGGNGKPHGNLDGLSDVLVHSVVGPTPEMVYITVTNRSTTIAGILTLTLDTTTFAVVNLPVRSVQTFGPFLVEGDTDFDVSCSGGTVYLSGVASTLIPGS